VIYSLTILGGIASGKSSCSGFFEKKCGFYLVDCDVISRKVVEIGKPAYKKIVK